MRITTAALLIALSSPASAFIDLGFVDGYEARIRQFDDPAPPVDYWWADPQFHIGTSFQHDFNGTTYWLTRADTIKFAPFTPPIPAVPEPSTWAMLIFGFTIIAAMFRRHRPHGRFTVRVT